MQSPKENKKGSQKYHEVLYSICRIVNYCLSGNAAHFSSYPSRRAF
ncbi:hypothetical protein HMPREF9248_0183 [Fannyhessea vaginae PB189-T1-4]|uniref:Uncharacterized protein n=1 Tax=Fannyhessea vaginae PB189-T1-4 TaxID=866774 RepID=A0ABP2J0P3_9ACTN|nr:hypothetical protein HMPREF9248_0183 [Fannyhessea vaginae PB189-T1-4]